MYTFANAPGKSTGSGENLASGASMEGAVKMWAAEKKDYKQGNGFSAKTGHFSEFTSQSRMNGN